VSAGCPADIVRAFIAAGANVNVKAKGGATPLMLAQALQRAEIVAVLKAAGARP
jgi:ankyrin repeat protein